MNDYSPSQTLTNSASVAPVSGCGRDSPRPQEPGYVPCSCLGTHASESQGNPRLHGEKLSHFFHPQTLTSSDLRSVGPSTPSPKYPSQSPVPLNPVFEPQIRRGSPLGSASYWSVHLQVGECYVPERTPSPVNWGPR